MEMLVCVAIVAILCAIALPSMAKAWQSYHLGSAASSLSGAIQSTRYQAIFYGCSYQLAISATSYQISSEVLSGTPPTCASTYTNVGSAVPFSQGDVSVGTAVTLTFNANGTVSTSATSSTNLAISTIVVGFTVPGQTAQRTITVSGVGYVTIS
jgi:Tfp pilus assembly protein FimT